MNSGTAPRVSMGFPIYNGEEFAASALDSLLGQSFSDFEIIISDNHSTDRSEAICREYATRDPRIRYDRADRNRGATWNFNRVFELSRGRYFKWASADDIHAPDYVLRCVEVLDARPDVVLCYPKTKIIDDSGAVVRDAEDNLDLPWPDAARRFREYLQRIRLSNAVFGLIRSETLRQVGRMGNYPGADVVLMAALCMRGAFAEVPEFLFYRRLGRQNEVRDQSLERSQEFYDPGTRGRIFMRTWRHQFEYLRAAFRSPLPLSERARISALIARIMLNRRGDLARELVGAAMKMWDRRPALKA